MSNINPPGYTPKSSAKINLKLDMNNILFTLISTQRGWLIRQALKIATTGGAAATTWLVSHGIAVEGAALTAGLSTVVVAAAEFALSKMASKIAAKP